MIVEVDKLFTDHLKDIKDTTLLKRAKQAIEKLENANSLREITNIKSMEGNPTYYRLRFSKFRIGFRLVDENTIRLLAIDHRSKFYRDFPEKFI